MGVPKISSSMPLVITRGTFAGTRVIVPGCSAHTAALVVRDTRVENVGVDGQPIAEGRVLTPSSVLVGISGATPPSMGRRKYRRNLRSLVSRGDVR